MGTKAVLKTIKQITAAIAFVLASALLLTLAVHYSLPQKEYKQSLLSTSSAENIYTVKAGQVVNGSFEVANDTADTYEFIVYPRPYSVSDESYKPDFATVTPKTDAYKWIGLHKTRYTVSPGGVVTVDYDLSVPSDLQDTSHYGAIVVEPLYANNTNDDFEWVRTAHRIHVTTKGNAVAQGKVAQFELPFWQNRAPLSSFARVINTGEADLPVKSSLTVKSILGTTEHQHSAVSVVLPGTTRRIETSWQKPPSLGLFAVHQKTEISGRVYTDSGYVLMVPRWFVALLIVTITAGGAYEAFKRYKKSS